MGFAVLGMGFPRRPAPPLHPPLHLHRGGNIRFKPFYLNRQHSFNFNRNPHSIANKDNTQGLNWPDPPLYSALHRHGEPNQIQNFMGKKHSIETCMENPIDRRSWTHSWDSRFNLNRFLLSQGGGVPAMVKLCRSNTAKSDEIDPCDKKRQFGLNSFRD